MALSTAKYEAIHDKTGGDLAAIKANFDNSKHLDAINFPAESAIIYQMQQMQDELTYLRTEIDTNKDKIGITSGQASAITANTAKVSLAGGSATAISFGEVITTNNGRGNPQTFSIVMTAVKSGVSKSVTLTLT